MMWNGIFNPVVNKYRDYLHNSYFDHLLANGITSQTCPEPVWCDINPITDNELSEPKLYYIVLFQLGRKTYPYLIPKGDNGPPSDDDIRNTMDRYITNPIPRGRDINNYIDFSRGIDEEVVKFMRENGLDDKVDFRWTDNLTS